MCINCQLYGGNSGTAHDLTVNYTAEAVSNTLTNDLTSPVAPSPSEFYEQTATTTGSSGSTYIDSVLYGTRWNGAITYSFPDPTVSLPWNPYTHSATGVTQVSFEQRQAVRYILEGTSAFDGGPIMRYGSYEAVCNLSISETSFQDTSSDLMIAQCDTFDGANLGSARVADFPELSNPKSAGDVWFGDDGEQYRNPVLGTYAWVTHIHELGHALGLKHPHQAYGTFNQIMPADRDSLEFTVMTYRNYIGGPTDFFRPETYGAPQTLMMYDIRALQHLYGADFTTNSGNTIYRWDPNTGEMYVNGVAQGTPGGNRIFLTIWDGNGDDIYDMSNYTNNVTINLNPGLWSVTSAGQLANLDRFNPGHYAQGNVYNALQFGSDTRSLIENAFGGSGNDTIDGNAANNVLRGNGGNDILYGATGIDIADYSGIRTDYSVMRLSNGSLQVTDLRGIDGSDTLITMEQLRFGDGLYDISGDARFNAVRTWDLNWTVVSYGDYNNDNHADIIWRNPSGVMGGWLMTNGSVSGTLQLPFFPDWTPLASGDFNHDGTDDIIWRNSSGLVAEWLMGNGTRQATMAIQYLPGWEMIATGDFNHDGNTDLIWRAPDGNTLGGWLMANGQIAGTLQLPSFGGWNVAATGDFNGDGNTDVLWQNASGLLGEWLMGNGTRQATQTLGTMPGWTALGTGDFNGDGTSDILWRNGSGITAAWFFNTNGQVAGTSSYGSTLGWTPIAFGDYNNDGRGDILWQNIFTGDVTRWLMNGGNPVGALEGGDMPTNLPPPISPETAPDIPLLSGLESGTLADVAGGVEPESFTTRPGYAGSDIWI